MVDNWAITKKFRGILQVVDRGDGRQSDKIEVWGDDGLLIGLPKGALYISLYLVCFGYFGNYSQMNSQKSSEVISLGVG